MVATKGRVPRLPLRSGWRVSANGSCACWFPLPAGWGLTPDTSSRSYRAGRRMSSQGDDMAGA